jgi:hypothetical protein
VGEVRSRAQGVWSGPHVVPNVESTSSAALPRPIWLSVPRCPAHAHSPSLPDGAVPGRTPTAAYRSRTWSPQARPYRSPPAANENRPRTARAIFAAPGRPPRPSQVGVSAVTTCSSVHSPCHAAAFTQPSPGRTEGATARSQRPTRRRRQLSPVPVPHPVPWTTSRQPSTLRYMHVPGPQLRTDRPGLAVGLTPLETRREVVLHIATRAEQLGYDAF